MSNIIKEEWRATVGYPGYEVSNLGRLKGIEKLSSNGRILKERLFRCNPNWSSRNMGYCCARLIDETGKVRSLNIHRLVARAFIGVPPTDAHQVCHNDSDPTNNHVSNLRYDTAAGNQADRILNGTSNIGEQNPRAKLTTTQVREIRRLYATGDVSQTKLARAYGVSFPTIHNIVHYKSWTSIA